MTGALPRGASLWAYLQLLRPANVVTAWADVLAGVAAAGVTVTLTGGEGPVALSSVGWLVGATTGLYGGGVVLNDVFDADVDADERPERPIPSGRVSRWGAALLGGALLAGGVGAASWTGPISALVAVLIAGAALLYDAWAKRHSFLGPLTMGLCRGGNLLLGMSAVPAMIASGWYLLLIPVIYIAAITAVSRGEVQGGTRRTGYVAVALVGTVIGSLLVLAVRGDYALLPALPFVLFLAVQVVPPFVRAAQTPAPGPIQNAVEAGVIALIPLDAALAAGFGGWVHGLGVLALLPVSKGFAQLFSVT